MTSAAVTVSLTLDEVQGCYRTAFKASGMRGKRGRFACVDPSAPDAVRRQDEDTGSIFDSPEFDDGSVLHCHTHAEALLLAKVHRGLGHIAYVLSDSAEIRPGEPLGPCVLTSWNFLDRYQQ